MSLVSADSRHVTGHSRLLIGLLATTFCACSALLSDRRAQEEKHRQMVHRMDEARIFVTPGDLPPTKPSQVLGQLKFSEPFPPDAMDTHRIQEKLKDLALARYPERADAVIKAKSEVEASGDSATLTVTGEVVQLDSSPDRKLMYNLWEDMYHYPVVSPK
jgi:hypothetical protein